MSEAPQPTAPAGRQTRSKARAAQAVNSPGVGANEFDSSLTSALLSLSTAFVQSGPSSGGNGGGGSRSRLYSEGSLDPEEDEQEPMEGDDEPMDCVKRDPSRVACVYRGDAPLTVKDFRNPAGGLFVRCRWCRARTTASSRATKARKEGLQPEFPLGHVPDPNVVPPMIGGMSTAGWEPVCSIKGCKAAHPLTINDFLNAYGDRLYRMCATCRKDAARSRDRNKKRKSGLLDDLSEAGGEKLDVETTPVPPCSGKGCAATRPLVLQDFLNPYGDALLKMCSFCRARHSSYKKAKKNGGGGGPSNGHGGERGREEEAAEVLSHLASGSASDGSEPNGKKKKSKAKVKSKAAVKVEEVALAEYAAPIAGPSSAGGFPPFDVGLPQFDVQAYLNSVAAAPPETKLHGAGASSAYPFGLADFSDADLSNIDPSLLPEDGPLDVLAAHASPPPAGLIGAAELATYAFAPQPPALPLAAVPGPADDDVPACATQSCKAKRPLTVDDFLTPDGKRKLTTCQPCRAYNVNRPSNLKKRQQKAAASEHSA